MEDFKHKKKYGQNFLTDSNLLKAICLDSGISKNDIVLEIGAGMGALTQFLAQSAKKVVAFEIDETLKDILTDKFSQTNNVELIFGDALETSIDDIRKKVGNEFSIVANLPYYITTPLLFKFLECDLKIKSMTVMVQKEVAERICSNEKNGDYGILSVMCSHYANVSIKRIVGKQMFNPVPKVDSAICHFEMKTNVDKEFSLFLSKVVKASFSMRRKTLVNNLNSSFGLTKCDCEKLINELGLSLMVRPENVSVENYEKLANLIKNRQY